MKKIVILVLSLVLLLGLTVTPVMAKGPTGAGGEMEYVPFNPNAWNHALLMVMPLDNVYLGCATTIWEDDTTIVVSAIPLAAYNAETGEWEGTHILLNWSRHWEAATYPESPYYTGEWTKQAWAQHYFWLNGSGTVTITREDGETQTVEEVTEFIFFRIQYVGGGMGNSDFTVGKDFDVTIQAYK